MMIKKIKNDMEVTSIKQLLYIAIKNKNNKFNKEYNLVYNKLSFGDIDPTLALKKYLEIKEKEINLK